MSAAPSASEPPETSMQKPAQLVPQAKEPAAHRFGAKPLARDSAARPDLEPGQRCRARIHHSDAFVGLHVDDGVSRSGIKSDRGARGSFAIIEIAVTG